MYGYYLLSKWRNVIMGIAAVWIMIFHATIVGVHEIFFVKIGYIGTDIFIFMAGVSAYYSLRSQPEKKQYYQKRLKRIVYPWIPFLMIGIYNSYEFFKNAYGVWNMQIFLIAMRSVRFWQDILTYRWYVPCILVCYFLIPFYAVKSAKAPKRVLFLTIASLLIFSIFALGKSTILMSLIRLPLFFGGYYISENYIYKNEVIGKIGRVLSALAILSLMGLYGAMKCFDVIALADYGIWWYLSILAAPGITLWLALVLEKLSGFHRVMKFFDFLGKYSLEIYLWHMLLIGWTGYILKKLTLLDGERMLQNFLPSLAMNVTAMIATIIIAVLYQRMLNCLKNETA
ncbi:acyltransferase [Lachnospiraceae bacterium ZAX-1]